jgi:CheY-like chemotaxis protein
MGTELYGGRVLVADDDRVNRMLLTRSLEREGDDGGALTALASGPLAERPALGKRRTSY